jgi:NADH dehydrogenase FAD-containing subunit
MKDRKLSRPNKRIVILGAGYGGIFLATNVARHIKEKTGEVILVIEILIINYFKRFI